MAMDFDKIKKEAVKAAGKAKDAASDMADDAVKKAKEIDVDKLKEQASDMAKDAKKNVEKAAGEAQKAAKDVDSKKIKKSALKNKKVLAAAAAILAIGIGAKVYAGIKAEEKVNKLIKDVPSFLKVSHEGVGFNLLGFDVVINDLLIETKGGENIAFLEEVIVNNVDTKSDFPPHLDLSLNGIKIYSDKAYDFVNIGSRNESMLKENFGNLTGDIAISYEYSGKDDILEINNLLVNGEGLGKIEINGVFPKFNPNKMFRYAFGKDKLYAKKIHIHYKDDSLINKLFELNGGKSETAKEVKDSLVDEMSNIIEKTIANNTNSLIVDKLNAMKEFIEDEGEITFSFDSPTINIDLESLQQLSKTVNNGSIYGAGFKRFYVNRGEEFEEKIHINVNKEITMSTGKTTIISEVEDGTGKECYINSSNLNGKQLDPGYVFTSHKHTILDKTMIALRVETQPDEKPTIIIANVGSDEKYVFTTNDINNVCNGYFTIESKEARKSYESAVDFLKEINLEIKS